MIAWSSNPEKKLTAIRGTPSFCPIQPLPEVGDLLAEQVLEYCETARTQSKIAGKFRRYGDPSVIQAIRALERQGRLRVVARGRNKAYEAV